MNISKLDYTREEECNNRFINVIQLTRADYIKAAKQYFSNYTDEQLSELDYEDISITELREIIFNYSKIDFYNKKVKLNEVHNYPMNEVYSSCYDPFNYVDEDFTLDHECLFEDCSLINIEEDIYNYLNYNI